MIDFIDFILDSIQKGIVVAPSDYSFKANFGTAYWIVINDIRTERII